MSQKFDIGNYVEINPIETGRKLKLLCKEKNITIKNLVELFGYSEQSIYKWFSGKSLPKVDNIFILSQLLQVKVDDILVSSKKEKENMDCFSKAA